MPLPQKFTYFDSVRVFLGTDDLQRHFQELGSRKKLPSLQSLVSHAEVLTERYSTTAAYEEALRMQSVLSHPRSEWDIPVVSSLADMMDAVDGDTFHGDWALANSIILLRDGIWSLEVCQAVTTGDIGRVWEVLKVSDNPERPS